MVKSEKDEKVARFIWTSWAKFAQSGEPGWPPFNDEAYASASASASNNCKETKGASKGQYLNIQLQPRCQNTGLFDEGKMAFWDKEFELLRLLLEKKAAAAML